MLKFLARIFDDRCANLRGRIIGIYALLLAANAAAWIWAFIAFSDYPILLGTALLAYGFGLRHAVDADHIAAIDNVTRKLVQEGRRPVGVGLFFSLGHSTVVVLASIAAALAASALQRHVEALRDLGGLLGTGISAFFLLAIAILNMVILLGTYRTFRRVRAGGAFEEADLDLLTSHGGLLARLLRPFFRMMSRSWHMYPLGFLFGLGFDTATEVALIGLSATEGAHGLPVWSILVFPALFTAGMSLVDTTDGILMLGAYGWALIKPMRKLYYNMTITFASVVVAVLVGGIELLGLVGDRLALSGRFWDAIGALTDNFGSLGYLIIAIFALSWIASILFYRIRNYGSLPVKDAAG
ncbi:MAG TPA: HoxN/HupN/NixA family nickel/cobalt transporter [Aliidongia sp.]|nr:HoxN/HupN/NixA family nickel/cobalt transporter [Aliidongia sp.]